MKLAYFAPLPPKRTGVAAYAAHLAEALSTHATIGFFDDPPSASPIPGSPVIDYVAHPEELLALPDYDAVLYQLGNNPEFHGAIFRAFLTRPGPVLLHDCVLYFLMGGRGPGGLLREFLANWGPGRLDEFFAIFAESPHREPLYYPHPERYPLLGRILAHAPRIIVHSATSAGMLREAGYGGPLDIVPHLAYPAALAPIDPDLRARTRRALGVDPGDLLLGNFGFPGPTKRLPAVLRTLGRLAPRLRFKLLLVGQGLALDDEIAAAGLEGRVILPGYVDDDRFSELLRALDILVNLRFPSMGETSGPQIQAMAAGIATIVTDNAWFAELPDDAVVKIPYGVGEEEALANCIARLAEDPARRDRIARSGRAYAVTQCSPAVVAQRFADILAGRENRMEWRKGPRDAS